MENPYSKWMIWGENPLFSETSMSLCCWMMLEAIPLVVESGLFPIQRTLPQIQPLKTKNERGFGQYISIHIYGFFLAIDMLNSQGRLPIKVVLMRPISNDIFPAELNGAWTKKYLQILNCQSIIPFRLGIPNPVNFVQKKPTPYKRCPTGPDPNAKILEVVAAHLRQRQNWDMAGRVQDVFFWTPQNWGFLGFCQILEATRNGGIVFFDIYLKICKDAMGGKSSEKKTQPL